MDTFRPIFDAERRARMRCSTFGCTEAVTTERVHHFGQSVGFYPICDECVARIVGIPDALPGSSFEAGLRDA